MRTLCCCRCSLKTGLTVIGLNRIIWGLIWSGNSFRVLVPAFIHFNDQDVDDDDDVSPDLFLALGAMLLVNGVLQVLLGIFTVYGAKELSPSLLKVSLILQVVLVGSIVITTILAISLIWIEGDTPMGMLLWLLVIPYLALEVYFWFALRSFYDQVLVGDPETFNLGTVHNASQHHQEIRNLAVIQESHRQQQQMLYYNSNNNGGQIQPASYGMQQNPPSYGQIQPSYGQVQPGQIPPGNNYGQWGNQH